MDALTRASALSVNCTPLMKRHDIFFILVVLPICVLLGSWASESSFAITLLVVLFGFMLGMVFNWYKFVPGGESNPDGKLLHPKYEFLIYSVIFILACGVVYVFPNVRNYGFFS